LKSGVSGRDPALRGAFVNAHMLPSMLRFPKGRAPWLMASGVFFGNRYAVITAFCKETAMGSMDEHILKAAKVTTL
jgi:hypothetical protein